MTTEHKVTYILQQVSHAAPALEAIFEHAKEMFGNEFTLTIHVTKTDPGVRLVVLSKGNEKEAPT